MLSPATLGGGGGGRDGQMKGRNGKKKGKQKGEGCADHVSLKISHLF